MNAAYVIIPILLFVAAYLLGSIPSAVWIGRRFYGIDVREHGSRNAGATNTLRVLGFKAAIPVFIIDAMKGYIAVALSALWDHTGSIPQEYDLRMALAVAAVIGHIFPVFARFKGGKGVSTIAGAVTGVCPAAVLLCLATFAVMLLLTHYVSLSSMTAGVMLPIYAAFVFHVQYLPLVVFCCAVAGLIIFTHRKNILRLLRGQEDKISFQRGHTHHNHHNNNSSKHLP